MAVLGEDRALPEIGDRKSVAGVGLSDSPVYAGALSERFSYTNTFYHCEPRFDVTKAGQIDSNSLDFVIASDVFEHVAPPIERAFENVYGLLKDGGAFVVTVPCTEDGLEVEHFPDLHEYEIVESGGTPVLKNITREGESQQFDRLVFHGGQGLTLEMRVFSRKSLIDHLRRAGFSEVRVLDGDCRERGILWGNDRSVPVVAIK